MSLPFFYSASLSISDQQTTLDEETSRHIVQVLRMQNGEQLQLTDGKGNIVTTVIADNNKKKCLVQHVSNQFAPASEQVNTIAISLVKNAHRFEWFLEKATEIGINEIIPLLCTRTEKQHFRFDRMNGILVSAMLQSQQCWLPVLHEPTRFTDFVKRPFSQQKFIAHCEEEERRALQNEQGGKIGKLVCIGPEGDFTFDEIHGAITNNFMPVELGKTRLRTETAGVVAATIITLIP